jgi:hypothetical protein
MCPDVDPAPGPDPGVHGRQYGTNAPVVPAGAPGELRVDARKADLIPEYH